MQLAVTTRRVLRKQELAAKRLRRQERLLAPRPIATSSIAGEDPLLRESKKKAATSRIVTLVVGAIVAHGVALGVIFGAARIAERLNFGTVDDSAHKIEVAVIEKVPPPEPPPPPPEPPKPIEEPPTPKKLIKKKEPPPDPTDLPPDPPKEAPAEEAAPVVGLSAESTVEGAGGPSFGVGNTRMGTTDKTAKDASDVKPMEKVARPKPIITAPKRTRRVEPAYPDEYRELGIEGVVTVAVVVDASGRPQEVALVKESEHGLFNLAAKKAALREEFSPATKDGVPVPYKLTYIYRFQLN